MKKSINKIMLLGAGELGKEVVISAKRLGKTVVAVDRYPGAPAMQVADHFEVINMLDAGELGRVVNKHRPDMIVPEIEAIRTERLRDFERNGITVIPTAEATYLTMNRVAIREVATKELGIRTARYAYATTLEELRAVAAEVGIPCVVKPVMSSSGKGQYSVGTADEIGAAWDYACSHMRGDEKRVIVEEFVRFHLEITLLTIRQWDGPTLFVSPVGHRQERGDYQESWMPAEVTSAQLEEAQHVAKKITDRLGGAGIFGVEFFITKDEVIFSELSPRPHDTGMVTMVSQDLSEFDLHVRAILGLPIPSITYYGASASAVILADRDAPRVAGYDGIDAALSEPNTQVRIFGKPDTRKYRRMGVALARAESVDAARKLAKQTADRVTIRYE
ncbi:MAG TPA: formate-dependent phosphoribosylglycinamide formyltransferase [Candidatus Krumholzibacteria bacterium]|nr:formate-dependent phosphoribosylglycinamide formyltransferase [Candidatus Krumholzibacteria bacterium]